MAMATFVLVALMMFLGTRSATVRGVITSTVLSTDSFQAEHEAEKVVVQAMGLGTRELGDSTLRFTKALDRVLSEPHNEYTFHTDKGKSERQAWAILYMDDEPYHQCGARALIASLRASGSTKDVLAIVPPATSNTSRTYLTALGYIVHEVPLIRPNAMRDGYYAGVFTAINLWNIDDYDRIVKLDTDMIVLQNMDELFMYSVFAATLDWPAAKPATWDDCKDTEICLRTAHDFRMNHMNGAMYVVSPDKAIYRDMVGILERHEEKLEGGPSEQGFLNWYFKNKWLALPYMYNVRFSAIQFFPQMFLGAPPRTFHYIGAYKPWKAPWDCNMWCRSQPLQYMFNAEWYHYYNMMPFTPETTPPSVTCYKELKL